MPLPSLDVQTVSGYALHYINFGADWATAIRRAMDRFGIPPARRGGVSNAVRNVLRSGLSITGALNAPGYSGTLAAAAGGAELPSGDVGVRVDFYNPLTGETRQQYVEARWDMSLASVVQLAFESLMSFYGGDPGWSADSYEVRGPTWLPAPSQR